MKKDYKCPSLTVDIIIEHPDGGIVLIKRKNPPHGWALPGGFVDYGESVESAAKREAMEETNQDLGFNLRQFRVYSQPDRDPRQHVVSVVFIGNPQRFTALQAQDDAKEIGLFTNDNLPTLAFDHAEILNDYFREQDYNVSGNLRILRKNS